MIDVQIDIDASALRKAIFKAPDVLHRQLLNGLHASALVAGREMRRAAPKAHSTLVNSITQARSGLLEFTVGPTVDYAAAVELKTGPQKMPSVLSIYDWIRVRRLQPHNRKNTQYDLAWLIARSISRKGTPAQPFVATSVEKVVPKIRQIMFAHVANALKEAGFHG